VEGLIEIMGHEFFGKGRRRHQEVMKVCQTVGGSGIRDW
jgi:hypothetical protein